MFLYQKSLQFWWSKFWILIVWETSDKKLLRKVLNAEYSSERETVKTCLVGSLAGVEQKVGFETERDDETFQMDILLELTLS